MRNLKYILVIYLCFFSLISAAADFPAKARLFAANTWAKNEVLNQEMVSQGLKEFDVYGRFGVEITYGWQFFEVGFAYMKRGIEKDETDSVLTTPYSARIDQDIALAVARIPIIKTPVVRADIYGGIGGSNTTFKVLSATQNGTLTKGESNSFVSPFMSYGASVGVGYKGVYFYVEGGFDSNKVEGFTRTGTISNTVQSIDFSGGYAGFGFLFDVMAYKK